MAMKRTIATLPQEELRRDSIDITHFTEKVSAKIHGLPDQAETYKTLVTEFIVFVMRSLASSGEIGGGVDKLTEEEVRAVRERLGRLCYL